MDETRHLATNQLDPDRRVRLGQFMTPSVIADFMVSLFRTFPRKLKLLDPGTGVGALTEAFAKNFLQQASAGASLETHCYEIEPVMLGYLFENLAEIKKHFEEKGLEFNGIIHRHDFIAEGSFQLGFGGPRFTHAILNPPYKKINSDSEHRYLLRRVGIETVNLYTAFLGLTAAMMEDGGEVVAIVPRSFCNGTYFRPFRGFFLDRVALIHIHVFDSRSRAFRDDEVLQENIIIHFIRNHPQGEVVVSSSHDSRFADYKERRIPFDQIVKPDDSERFIHIPTSDVKQPIGLFECSLEDLGLEVSTGPVVDFRLREHWLPDAKQNCIPLLYAHHFQGGQLIWPKTHKKPNALRLNNETRKWIFPRGCYTITKRFSSKEERRRLVAFVIQPNSLPYDFYGFENHLNVFHSSKNGLSSDLAFGLALFLNSTVADRHFRNFSGHTQVNATDLRSMRYPGKATLTSFGRWAKQNKTVAQEEIDQFIEKHAQ